MDQQSVTIEAVEEHRGAEYWAVTSADRWETVCPNLSAEDAAMLAPVVVIGATPITVS